MVLKLESEKRLKFDTDSRLRMSNLALIAIHVAQDLVVCNLIEIFELKSYRKIG